MNRNVLVFHLPNVGPNIIHLEIKPMFSGIHRRVITITGLARTFYGHACRQQKSLLHAQIHYIQIRFKILPFIGIELCVFADMSAKVFSNNWNLSGIARTNISFFKNKLVIAIQKISLNQMFCGEFFKSNHKRSV